MKPGLFCPKPASVLMMKPDQVLYIFLVWLLSPLLHGMLAFAEYIWFCFQFFESVASCLLQLAFIGRSQECFSAFTSAGHFPDLVRFKSFDSFLNNLDLYVWGPLEL